jgi:hypothetical protein
MPLEFQDAYDEGTRSFDGKPGYNYWQNNADYDINVTVTPSARTVSGSETIVYYNKSPDILDTIVIRLYQNINRPGNQRDFTFDEKFFTKGIEIKSFSVDNTVYDLKDTSIVYSGTNMIIKDQWILPGEQLKINISWEFEVPAGNFVRMGAYDSTVFFIAYWYPQIAVYDDIYGWDLIEYSGGTEFYNDFNNYKVSITVPNNIGVWATGELLNPEQVFSPSVYSRYSEALGRKTLIKIISAQDYENNKPVFKNDNSSNTWKFKAQGVPDFTFGLSDRHLWDGKTVFDGTKNVFVSAVYDPGTTQFFEVCEVTSRCVEMMSHDLPGIPFPYPKITVFNGGGGVESPMMVNMAAGRERIWMVHTTVHEVMHTIFPFHMGIDERRYAWMDEGWTQMLSEYIQLAIDTTIDFRQRNVKRYIDMSGSFNEVPMMYPSYIIRRNSYGYASYFRPAAAYNILKDILDSRNNGLFKLALLEYINRWNGKHPTPYDFFFTFEDVIKENLDWFWEPWFFEQGYPELHIDTAFVQDGKIKILVDKQGNLPVPVLLRVEASDGSVMNIYSSADIWKNNDDEMWFEENLNGKTARTVSLGSKYIPDADTTNNMWKVK